MAKAKKSRKTSKTVGQKREDILTKATRGNKNDPKPKGKRLNADKYIDAQ